MHNRQSRTANRSAQVLYGAGPMIGLLLGAGAHHYTEFKLVQGR